MIDFHAHTFKKPGPKATVSLEQMNDAIRRGLRSPSDYPAGYVPSAAELVSSLDTPGVRQAGLLLSRPHNIGGVSTNIYEPELQEAAQYPGRFFIFAGPEDNRWDDPKKAADQVRKRLQAGVKGIGSVSSGPTIEPAGPAMEVAAEFDVTFHGASVVLRVQSILRGI